MQINNVGKIIMDNPSVHDFLECMTSLYNNEHDVGIMTNLFNENRDQEEGDYISVSAIWQSKAPAMPFHDETIIASFYCSTIDQFMQAFGINDAVGINSITPGHLFDLYLQGKAEIECTVSHLYDDYSLYFSQAPSSSARGGRFEDAEHTVPLLLDTREQIIRYTRQHFMLDEMPVTEREKLRCGVYHYLESEDMLQNKWGVEFELNALGERDKGYSLTNEYSLTISASWPSCSANDDPTGLSVVYKEFDLDVLIKTLGITSPNGLKEITPGQLQMLYYQGKACICCWLHDEKVGLYFRLKKNGSLIASEYYIGNSATKRIYEVPELLETPEQFIAYTRQYYRYMRLFE